MSLTGRELTLCWDDQARLDPLTRQEFHKELSELLRVEPVPCAEASVRVTILRSPEARHDGALGVARVSGGRIEPELSVFVQPVSRLLFSSLPVYVGKALARVAAHEVAHYVRQQAHHDCDGVLAGYVTGARLMSANAASFRLYSSR